MQGDKFYIEIESQKVQIVEPFDFSQVDFSITQDNEYFFRRLSVAGNKTDLRFIKQQHKEVFDDILNHFITNGFNAEVYFWYNDIRMRLSFATAETNYLDYIKCQAINDTIIDILNDNKDVKVDLLSDKDIYENDANPLNLSKAYATAMGIKRESIWKNKDQRTLTKSSEDSRSILFNSISQITKSDIKNTYVPYAKMIDISGVSVLKSFEFLEFKDNYKNLNISTMTLAQWQVLGLDLVEDAKLTIYISRNDLNDQAWLDYARKFEMMTAPKEIGLYDLGQSRIINIENINRGDSLYMCWEAKTKDRTINSATRILFKDLGCQLIVNGESYALGSVIKCATYKDCISNLISKIYAGANVRFDSPLSWQANNILFSGNQVRFGDNKPFILTWKEVVEQLKEFGLGYRIEENTIIFDQIRSFYKAQMIHEFNKIDSKSFKITHDDKYNVNIFEYGYKKYQAKKDGELEGNAGTINGESQWYLQNKFTENSLNIDLPISRDKYLLEDIRIKSLAYSENTSTNEDNTLYLFEKKNEVIRINESAFLRAEFDEENQTQNFLVIDSEFSWTRIGVTENITITFEISGLSYDYKVLSSEDNAIYCERISGNNIILNRDSNFSFNFIPDVDFTLDVGVANNAKSIRQNLNKMRDYLTTYNYYNDTKITNREYKEDAEFELNGIKEVDPISNTLFQLSPKIIEFKAKDSFETFKKLSENVDNMCSVLSPKNEIINFFIKEVTLKNNASNCNESDFTIKGQIYDS